MVQRSGTRKSKYKKQKHNVEDGQGWRMVDEGATQSFPKRGDAVKERQPCATGDATTSHAKTIQARARRPVKWCLMRGGTDKKTDL